MIIIDPYEIVNEKDHLIKANKMVELKRHLEKVFSLLGYVNVTNGHTGGDDDFFVVDQKRKWTYWENGFAPFCNKNFETNKTLTYWIKHRK